MKSPIVGIDLGTTFSLIGVMDEGRPRLVRSATGNVLFPSAVFLEGDTFHVGEAARSRVVLAPDKGALHFKRDMGTGRAVSLGRTLRPEELSALVLRCLKEAAEADLGVPVSEAVISVPAYFGEAQRQATRTAAQLAGLNAVRLINEPTAAAIAYGVTRLDKNLRVAVLDLGGGTFDVTLLELIEGVIEIRSSAGDLFLGGLDFDRELSRWLVEASQRQGVTWADDGLTTARLLEAAERAKKALSERDGVDVVLSDLAVRGGGRATLTLRLDRAQAELCWEPLKARLLRPVRQAFTDAGWSKAVDEVVLVGGSSRLPLVRRLVVETFGIEPLQPLPPDEAVAWGAVLTAGLMENNEAVQELVVTDIAPFSMGTALGHLEGGVLITGIYKPVIDRGTVIPCSRRTTVSPLYQEQTVIEVEIYQGEHAMASRNTRLGTLKVPGIPLKGDRSVLITYTYDLNGLLEVEATVLATGATLTKLVNQGNAFSSPQQLEAAQAALQQYKIHPADKLENAAVLAQAEVLYQELLGADREMLGQAIADFRLALESGGDAGIEAVRRRLRDLLGEHW